MINLIKMSMVVFMVYGVYRHYQQYFSWIVTVSFWWRKSNDRRKPLTYPKSLTNFIT